MIEGILIDSERLGTRALHAQGPRGVDEGRGGRSLGHDLGDHLTLTLRTTDIALRILVAHTRELQGGGAVHRVAARSPVQARILVVRVVVVAQLHAADRVHHVRHRTHADLHEVIDGQTRQLLDCLDQELGAAVGVGSVDLVPADPRDLRVGVAGNRQGDRLAVGRDVDQHDRVSAFGSLKPSCTAPSARESEPAKRYVVPAVSEAPDSALTRPMFVFASPCGAI